VGKLGKPYLAKIIHQFGHENFDYLIFNYDGASFDETVFGKCHIINGNGILCSFFKKYLTPNYCQEYDYIFTWVDDINIDDFSYIHFLDIFEKNQLEMGQPALSHVSLYFHEITLRKRNSVGRFTDFAEKAWIKYWELIEADKNFWGWGYDYLAKSFCGFQRIGIIDSETVTHMNRSSYKGRRGKHISMKNILNKHKAYKICEKKVSGYLRDGT